MNLIKKTKFMSAVTPTAGVAGTSAINGTTLDVQGFEGIIAYVRFGAIVSGAVVPQRIAPGAASQIYPGILPLRLRESRTICIEEPLLPSRVKHPSSVDLPESRILPRAFRSRSRFIL